jgi:Cellulase (glycosyl hydrolase family 5)
MTRAMRSVRALDLRNSSGRQPKGWLPSRAVRLRVFTRYALVASALLCIYLLAGSAFAGTANTAHQVRTYSTPPTMPLRTALWDPVFSGLDPSTPLAIARSAGASYVRLHVPWYGIAPKTPPTGFVAADPMSPGYSWTHMDRIVTAAEEVGLTPILDVLSPPTWASKVLPKGVNGATPDIASLRDFATALATHYNGLTPGVPAEHVFQVWNEVNNSLHLNPVSASTYRAMVNAVADAVHAVDPANLVVAGALDPFGHPKTKKQTWYSVAPLAFMRSLLCLSKGKHPHATCKDPVHFDVWSHHPYTFGGAFGKAKKSDDIELGDLPRMRALLRAGIRLHRVISTNPPQFWVTEFGWDTNPPRPHAAPLGLAARWTAESLHQMWLSGISLVTWFLLEDYPSPSQYQSGLYFHAASLPDAQPKPGLTAFRFPFVAYLQKKKTVSVWGRDATSDRQVVIIQRRHGKGGSWRSVAKITSNANGIFLAKLKLKATKKDWLRAVATGSSESLAFSLNRPKDPHIGPWGN